MSILFTKCSSLKELPDISKWNTKNVFTFSHMFFECVSLKSLPDISKWNMEKVSDFRYMFSGCTSLNSLPEITKWIIDCNADITNMFNRYISLKDSSYFSQYLSLDYILEPISSFGKESRILSSNKYDFNNLKSNHFD